MLPACPRSRSSSRSRSSPRELGPGSSDAGVRARMEAPGEPEGPGPPGPGGGESGCAQGHRSCLRDDPLGSAREAPRRLSREQLFTLILAASINLGSTMCYSVLGPFFPEAKKKGASNTVIGIIFGCYALFKLLASLVFGKYLVHIGAKFMFVTEMFVSGGVTILFGIFENCFIPEGPVFIAVCFLVRVADVISFTGALTASFSILVKAFPNNVATVLWSLEIFSQLGLVLGPPLGGFLYQSFGYELPLIFLGCIVLLMVPLNMYILPNFEAGPGEYSFWKLITPKVALISFVINSRSSGFGFLDPTLSLFVLEKFSLPAGYVGLVFLGLALCYAISSPVGLLSNKMPHLRKWLLVFGNLITAGCYMLLGPVPVLHIKSQLWLLMLVLVVNGISAGMSITPVFPEILSCAYENGFEEGSSTLELVSGLFGAMCAFLGRILGGFLYEKIGFEWAAAIQGLLPLTSLTMGLYYLLEHSRRRRSVSQDILGTEEERTVLLPNEI
ncbi:LOW QUALITY PROTEIN: MFS-type transporter SLC18B1 [Trichechus inunguis]